MPCKVNLRNIPFLALVVSCVLLGLFSTPKCDAQQVSEADLIAVLADESSSKPDRALACKKLAVFGSAACIDELAPLLKDPELTSWARIALESIEAPEAEAALLAAINQLQGLPLVGVINSLGVKRSIEAVAVLKGFLGDGDAEVAKASALALGKIGGREATAILRDAIAESREEVRSVIAEGLIRCAEGFSQQGELAAARSVYDLILTAELPKQRFVEATRGAILSRGVDGIELLVGSLASDDFRIRGIALKAARQLKVDGAIEALIGAIDQVPGSQQALYLFALGERGEDAIVPTLLRIVEEQATDERAMEIKLVAVELLQELGTVSCLDSLVEAAKSGNAALANAAINTLARIDDVDLDDVIVDRITNSEGDEKRIMIRLIGERRIISAVEPLLKVVEDSNVETRMAALRSLGNVASLDEISTLIDRATRNDAEDETKVALGALKSACVRISDQAACAQKLSAALGRSKPPAQLVILETLAGMGGPDALKVIGEVAVNGNADLQNAATRLLGGWMTVDAGPVLMKVAKQPKHAYRIRALRAYLRLVRQFVMDQSQRHEMAQAALKIATRDEERLLVLDAAQRYPSEVMLRIAVELSKQASLREASQKAALKIAGKVKRSANLVNLLEQLNLPRIEVKITEAIYGAKGRTKDVTDALRERVSSSPLILLDDSSYNRAFGGDVAPGFPKTLTVKYSIDGKSGEAEFNEDDTIVLPLPGEN